MQSRWQDGKAVTEIEKWIKELVTAAGDGAAKTAATTANTKFGEYKKKQDPGTLTKLKSLYLAGVKAVTDAENAGSGDYEVKLLKYTSPQFWHNAKSAGKVPVWTYEYYDTSKKDKKTQVAITMSKTEGENEEKKQSEAMNNLAIASVKKVSGVKTVKLVS